LQFTTVTKSPLKDADRLLSDLINTPVCLDILADGEPIGRAELDLLSAVSRGGSSVAERLHLHSLVDSVPVLLDSANVTITVSFWRDADDSRGELSNTTPVVEVGNCGPDGCVPYEFVSTSDAARCSIISARVISMEGTPESLKAGAALSGGFTAQAGVLWPHAGTSCGCSVASADWSDSQLSWLPPKRGLLRPEQFAALQEAVTKQHPIFVELARCVFGFG
jgi:hypothetical protein